MMLAQIFKATDTAEISLAFNKNQNARKLHNQNTKWLNLFIVC